jgi:hypothetical protein
LWSKISRFFQIHLFLNAFAVCGVRADSFIDPGVEQRRADIFNDEIDKEFGVELFQFEVEVVGAVALQFFAKHLAFAVAEIDFAHWASWLEKKGIIAEVAVKRSRMAASALSGRRLIHRHLLKRFSLAAVNRLGRAGQHPLLFGTGWALQANA